jgi:thiamine pyrophosphate-dependent acetolactate synthase large subunit-like protein
MNGDQAIARILKAEGVEWMACFPAQTLIDVAAREGIRPILCRQERCGVNMADGFSRVNNARKIGVFTMQSGPGAENAFPGVAQAFADSVPILLLPGGSPRNRIGVAPGFDSFQHYGGVTKWVGHINMASRIPEMMRRAFTLLKHGHRGPVVLEIPRDVATEEIPDSAFKYAPVGTYRSEADQDDVRELVSALLQAQRPVIYAGQGVLYSEATDELVEFAELTNIPVMTTLAGKSAFPEDHRLALGTGGYTGTLMVKHFLDKADFVLGMGSSFTNTHFNAPLPRQATLAQSTNCAEDVNKDYAVSYGAIGDAKLVLRQMIEEVKRQLGEHGRGDASGFAEEIATVKAQWMAEWGPRLSSTETPISPYRVLTELTRAVDLRNTIVTHDSGYPRDQFVPFWPALAPRSYIGWGKSTQLGYGLGLAMGAKLAQPDKQVINVMGDAAVGMMGMDFETAVRSEIPILTVILNNGVMTHYDAHMPFASEKWGSNRLGGNYAKVAEGLGAFAQRVEAPNQIASAIRKAIAANQKGQPAVIEMITKEETTVAKYW